MALFPITLAAALAFSHVREPKREGAIALPPDAEYQPQPAASHDAEVERLRIRMEDEERQQTGPAQPQQHNGHQQGTVEESVWG